MLAQLKNASFWRGYKLHLLVAMLVLMLHAVLVYALWRAHARKSSSPTPVVVRLIHESVPTPRLKATPSIARPQAATPKAGKAMPEFDTVLPMPQSAPKPVFRGPIENAVPSAAPGETVAIAVSASGMGDVQPDPSASHVSPVSVSGDVSLACPIRAAPVYPLTARKLGETGTVVLRIELDQAGRLVGNEIAHSSGFARLDEAARAAVRSWRCHPATRDGQALRIVSMESFDFRLGD